MYAAIRRYEGLDPTRRDELIQEIRQGFIPLLEERTNCQAYYAIESGDDVITTIGIFDTVDAAEESSQLAREFIQDEGLSDLLPNPPIVTAGEIVAQKIPAAIG
jgi:hypothetical protein